jgi:two-component system, NarL family, response regulator FusR
LLLIALRLGTGDSLEFLKALKSEHPALLILVYSAFEETIFAERAFRAGADGYVMKKAPKDELLTAIREIMSGNIYVSRDVAMRAFKKSLETRSEQQHRSARPTIGIEKLSDREMHIFFLLGSGLGNSQIAHSLNLRVTAAIWWLAPRNTWKSLSCRPPTSSAAAKRKLSVSPPRSDESWNM